MSIPKLAGRLLMEDNLCNLIFQASLSSPILRHHPGFVQDNISHSEWRDTVKSEHPAIFQSVWLGGVRAPISYVPNAHYENCLDREEVVQGGESTLAFQSGQ